jgi:hypothetical protein
MSAPPNTHLPKKGISPMEEQQIQEFVHRVSNDEALRKELTIDPEGVIVRQGFSPRVAQVVARLVPQLTLNQEIGPSLNWWPH